MNASTLRLKAQGRLDLDGTHEAVIRTDYARAFELFSVTDGHSTLIQVTAGARTCGCVLATLAPSKENRIELDRLKLAQLGVKDGEEVTIEALSPDPASSLTLRCSKEAVEDCRSLRGKPLVKGERTALYTISGEAHPIEVLESEPSGIVVVAANTALTFVGGEADGLPLRYEDIGGLQREIRSLRELVEYPLRYPGLFDRLGIQQPRGVILHGPPGSGKTILAQAMAAQVGAHLLTVNGAEIYSKWYGDSEQRLKQIFENACKMSPSFIVIDELDALVPRRESSGGELEHRVVSTLMSLMDNLRSTRGVVVIGTTNRINKIDPALRREGRFAVEVHIGTPDTTGRLDIMRIHSRRMPLDNDVDLEQLARRTVGFVGADLVTLCREAGYWAIRELSSADPGEQQSSPEWSRIKVASRHFQQAMTMVRPSAMREFSIEVPDVAWEDIGGLDEVKRMLIENITYAITRSEAYAKAGVKPARGILLYGPPGTGKTLLAKAAARQSGANFIAIQGPEIRSKWFGDSEDRIRAIFAKARDSSPCVIFFDEIDALAPARGRGDSSATDSIVNQLLTEIDGVQTADGVITLAATNRPELLDPALLRSGRFDYQIEVPLPDSATRLRILQIHLANKPLAQGVGPDLILDQTDQFSGADLAEICRQAGMRALRRAEFVADHVIVSAEDLVGAFEDVRKATEDLRPGPFGLAPRKK